jgi:hypothetical protein
MDLTAFLPSSKSNSKINENQITFGTINFLPHPPTLAPFFADFSFCSRILLFCEPFVASLDWEMDLTIGSFNFRIESLGSLCLSHPIPSGPSAGKTTAVATSETFVGSTSEVISPAIFKPVEGKRNIVDELGEIMENRNLKESSDYSDMESEGNSDIISNYSD